MDLNGIKLKLALIFNTAASSKSEIKISATHAENLTSCTLFKKAPNMPITATSRITIP